jgi:hypothetical protein
LFEPSKVLCVTGKVLFVTGKTAAGPSETFFVADKVLSVRQQNLGCAGQGLAHDAQTLVRRSQNLAGGAQKLLCGNKGAEFFCDCLRPRKGQDQPMAKDTGKGSRKGAATKRTRARKPKGCDYPELETKRALPSINRARSAQFAALSESVWRASLQLQPIVSQMQSTFAEALKGFDLRASAEGFKRYEAAFGEQLRILAQNGWYISWRHTPLASIFPFAALFRDGHTEEGHRRLCSHFAECLTAVESSLASEFPRRAAILKKAFEAHGRGDYELSIPVFLSQADGISKEVFGASIYSRRKSNVDSRRDFIATIAEQRMERDFLEVALILTPLNASERDRALLQDALNRHEILHGVNTSYASTANSLKAVSWLQYVAEFYHADTTATIRRRSIHTART